jgi:hypothetical protein
VKKGLFIVDSMFLKFIMLAMLACAAWKLGALSLKGLVSLLSLGAVIGALAPGAYAAAKAELALPQRDLAFDFDGNDRDAKLFSKIVKDRLARTAMAAERPEYAWRATNIGRKFAEAA